MSPSTTAQKTNGKAALSRVEQFITVVVLVVAAAVGAVLYVERGQAAQAREIADNRGDIKTIRTELKSIGKQLESLHEKVDDIRGRIPAKVADASQAE